MSSLCFLLSFNPLYTRFQPSMSAFLYLTFTGQVLYSKPVLDFKTPIQCFGYSNRKKVVGMSKVSARYGIPPCSPGSLSQRLLIPCWSWFETVERVVKGSRASWKALNTAATDDPLLILFADWNEIYQLGQKLIRLIVMNLLDTFATLAISGQGEIGASRNLWARMYDFAYTVIISSDSSVVESEQ